MRFTRFLLLSAVISLGLSLLPLAAEAAPPPAGSLALRLSGVPAGATKVLVELESPLTRAGARPDLAFYPLTVAPVTGASMTAMVPPSRLLRSVAAAQHGIVNLQVIVLSATRGYPQFVSVRLDPAGSAAVSSAAVSVARFDGLSFRGRFLSSSRTKADPLVGCQVKQLSSTESTTRIGELHVTAQAGVSGNFNSGNTADNNITVGFSSSGSDGTYSVDGSVTVSNSIGTGGGFGRTGYFLRYVDGDVYYGRFIEACPASDWYFIQATSSVGDAFPGSQSPPLEPYPSCADDPNGHAVVAAGGGHWNDDRSRAYGYTGIANLFGFKFGGSDGYTNVINEGWDDSGPDATFVCGNKNPMPTSSVFWDGWV